jgi:ABC-type antimicrobial peptide transport system permease subunit
VLAQHTARRTREIGIRMALGATSRQILSMVLSLGVKQIVVGLVLGLVGATTLTHLMSGMLLDISPTDPLVFGAVSAVLVGVGLFACWPPARGAAALPPTEALRQD